MAIHRRHMKSVYSGRAVSDESAGDQRDMKEAGGWKFAVSGCSGGVRLGEGFGGWGRHSLKRLVVVRLYSCVM